MRIRSRSIELKTQTLLVTGRLAASVLLKVNPGAFIDNLTIEDLDGTESEDEVIIFWP